MQNREIKFRGFDKLHNTWIYGDLIRIPTGGGDYNTPPSSELTTYVTNSHVLTHEWVEVDPNSVGQFTGLHDKNGTPIYENDYVIDGDKKRILVEYNFSLLGRLKEISKELILDGNIYE